MTVRLYCPETLDLEAIIEAHPLGAGVKRDSLVFILHSIIQEKAYNDPERWRKLGKREGFVPLHSKVLEGKVPAYRRHLDWLLSAGIIESDEDYTPGVVSTGYRFTTPYAGVKYKRVEVRDFVLCRKIKADKIFSNRNAGTRLHPYLWRWFLSGKLQINRSAAFKWLEEQEEREVEALIRKRLPRVRFAAEKAAIVEKCANQRHLIDRIVEHKYFYTVDDTGNRLHTNLTNLPKEIRDFISYDGRQLVSIDIKNSQPYMSMALFDKRFWQSNIKIDFPTLKRMNKGLYERMRKGDSHYLYSIMFVHSSETPVPIDFRKELFFRKVIQGEIYEYLQEVFEDAGHYLGSTPAEKRIKVKNIVLTCLFDDDWKIYNRKPDSFVQVFRNHFPSIARVFGYIKGYGYRNLSILLQRIESFLLLDKICHRISQERPDIPLFTIHDNVVTTLGNEEYVKSVMRGELERIMGAAPQLSVEYWKRPVPVIELSSCYYKGFPTSRSWCVTGHGLKRG